MPVPLKKPISNIVITGAGPIGLYAAIKLRQAGVNNITVIDPKLNDYNRPGILNSDSIERFAARISANYSPLPAKHQHIKDVERFLFPEAEKLGIRLRKEKFLRFSAAGAIETTAADNTQPANSLPCDLAIDCSGAARVLVHAVNRINPTPPFQIQRSAENPAKTHFIAYGKMAYADTYYVLQNSAAPLYDLSTYQKNLQKLKDKFGWKHQAAPQFFFLSLHKGKVCIYGEAPDDLRADQQEAWLKAMLQLKSGRPNIPFTPFKPESKPTYTTFTVDPHEVVETLYPGDDVLPMIIPAGDAQIEPDYRIAFGLNGGSDRIDALIKAFTIENGVITAFDKVQYEMDLAEIIGRHKLKLQFQYQFRQLKLEGNESEAEEANKKVRSLAIDSLLADAKRFMTNKNYRLSENCLTSAISVYSKFLADSHFEQSIKIHALLVSHYKLTGDSQKALEIADKALSFADSKKVTMDKSLVEIIYHKIDIMLATTESNNAGYQPRLFTTGSSSLAFYEIKMQLQKLMSNTFIATADYNNLYERLKALGEKFKPSLILDFAQRPDWIANSYPQPRL